MKNARVCLATCWKKFPQSLRKTAVKTEEWLGIDNIEPSGDGFIANLALPDDGGLVNKILSYGGAVKVLQRTKCPRAFN